MTDQGARASSEPIQLGRRRTSGGSAPAAAAPAPDHSPPAVNDDDDGRFAPAYEPDEREHRSYQQRDTNLWPLPPKPGEVRMPRNVEAEAALLGAMMIDNRVMERERGSLDAKHFFEPLHGRIYDAMLRELDRGNMATPITLRPILENDAALKEVGGPAYLAGLTGSSAGLIGAAAFAKQIIELAARRDLYDTFQECSTRVLDTAESTGIATVVAAIDEQMSKSIELDRRTRANSGVSVQTAWDEAFDDMCEATDIGAPTGLRIEQYDDWNDVVGPLTGGDLVYLGGRPSMGKTGVAVKVMMGAAAAMEKEVAVDDELPGAVEFFSLEMSRKPIMQRAIADAIYKPGETSKFDALINGRMTTRDKALIRQMREQIDGLPLNITDPTSQMMVENFASEIRRRQRAWLKKGRQLKLVIADYLGRFGTIAKFQSERDKVTHISSALKSAAKECDVALVVLCQLSRSLESREDKRPILADLRDSGSLEQDADMVAFVYRDQYYLERSEPPKAQEAKWNAWDMEMSAARDRMELIGGKRRQGALARRTGYFITDAQAVRSSEWRWGDDLFSFGDGGVDRMT